MKTLTVHESSRHNSQKKRSPRYGDGVENEQHSGIPPRSHKPSLVIHSVPRSYSEFMIRLCMYCISSFVRYLPPPLEYNRTSAELQLTSSGQRSRTNPQIKQPRTPHHDVPSLPRFDHSHAPLRENNHLPNPSFRYHNVASLPNQQFTTTPPSFVSVM